MKDGLSMILEPQISSFETLQHTLLYGLWEHLTDFCYVDSATSALALLQEPWKEDEYP